MKSEINIEKLEALLNMFQRNHNHSWIKELQLLLSETKKVRLPVRAIPAAELFDIYATRLSHLSARGVQVAGLPETVSELKNRADSLFVYGIGGSVPRGVLFLDSKGEYVGGCVFPLIKKEAQHQ